MPFQGSIAHCGRSVRSLDEVLANTYAVDSPSWMMNRSNVWNYWIICPGIFWVPIRAADALLVYRREPISESGIQREIDRQAGQPY